MNPSPFASRFALILSELTPEAMHAFTAEDFFLRSPKQQVVLGDVDEPVLSAVFDRIKDHRIANATFDVELDFGQDPLVLNVLDPELIVAYTYTAYAKLFTDVLEPMIGKGNVFAVIHGGPDMNGMLMQPFMQLLIVSDERKVQLEDMSLDPVFDDWFSPIKSAIAHFMMETYPAYVSDTDEWVELSTFEHTIRAMPLVLPEFPQEGGAHE